MNETLRAYIDLFRLQFFFAWPLLFCSGYLLATATYGGFSWPDLGRVALIGFFGFEAGLGLNDYIDRNYGAKDVERNRLTRYWRLFGTRPIPDGLISPRVAAGHVIGLVMVTAGLILTLPYPHSVWVLLLYANAVILRDRSPGAGLRVLPCFHVAMVLYALGISVGAFL